MFLVGLTGGIATGKSLVASFFKESGIPVIDADLIARQSKYFLCNTCIVAYIYTDTYTNVGFFVLQMSCYCGSPPNACYNLTAQIAFFCHYDHPHSANS